MQLPLPSDMPEEVKLLIQQCWHPEPSQRPTCDEILDKLNQLSLPDHWKALFGSTSPLLDTPEPEEGSSPSYAGFGSAG